MSISASDVKKLRDMTGAGMMDAKQALKETNGDFDAAVKYLREKGLADSKKRSDIEANQGTIGEYIHFQQDRAVAGVLVELACETDFVAKSPEFKDIAKQIAMHVAAMRPGYLNIEDIPEDKINEEKEIILKQSENEGKPKEVMEKIEEKSGEQSGATSLVGATNEDLEALGYKKGGGKTIDLMDVAGKKGGQLSMDDFIDLHS